MKHFTFSCLLLFLFLSNSVLAQKDTIPPVIVFGDTFCIEIGSVWIDQVDYSDNQTSKYDIIFTKKWGINGPVNTLIRKKYSVVYEATDTNGNKTTAYVNYRVDDCIPPVIELNTPDRICTEYGQPYNRVLPTASDNFYPSKDVSLVLISSDVNTNVIGLYQDIYEAVDGSGNTVRKIRIVEVKVGCNTSNISKSLKDHLAMYPVPASGNLFIQMLNEESATMQIFSSDGKLIIHTKLHQGLNTLNLEAYSKGLYTIIINNENEVYKSKLLIE